MLRAEICPPFDRRFVYHYPYPLDEAKNDRGPPRLLEGEHDFFSAFAAADPVVTWDGRRSAAYSLRA